MTRAALDQDLRHDRRGGYRGRGRCRRGCGRLRVLRAIAAQPSIAQAVELQARGARRRAARRGVSASGGGTRRRRARSTCGPTVCSSISTTSPRSICRQTVECLPVVRSGAVPATLPASQSCSRAPAAAYGERADWTEARALGATSRGRARGRSRRRQCRGSRSRRRSPFGVDVSSGVESARGIKDPPLIDRFVERRRDARRTRRPPVTEECGNMRIAGLEHRPRSIARADAARRLSGCARPVRAVRRPLRAGNAGAGARPARGGRAQHPARRGVSRRSSKRSSATGSGRPTPLTHARELSRRWGAEVWLKREDLAHTGAHKINNAIGQALLAKRLGAKRIVAETGAGQHGVATAAACARLGMPCVVYMGAVDIERQAPNVGRMNLLGAEVVPVHGGDQTLRAAIDEALRDWVADPNGTYYLLGSAVGPHPYPYLVREFQSIIGLEARAQMLEQTGHLPDVAVACVGGGSNAIGLFHPFVRDARCASARHRSGRHGPRARARMRRRSRTARPACCRAATRCCCRMSTARSRKRIRSPRGSIIRASGPSTRCSRAIGRVQYDAPRTTKRRSRRWPNAAAPKASCRRSSRRTHLPARAG